MCHADVLCSTLFWGGFATVPQNAVTQITPHTQALEINLERIKMKFIVTSMLLLFSVTVNAGVISVTTSESKVSAVRIESKYALVSFSNQSDSDCSKGRAYLDLDNEYHKVAYSTALAAYMSGKSVAIRTYDNSSLVFGTCKIYDIYVSG